jgi:MFS family permease
MPRRLQPDVVLLFSTRILRLFAYGFVSVVLALYLSQVGFGSGQIGLIFTLALAGDAAISLWLTTSADRFGRRRTLIIGALLMIAAGIVFTLARNWAVLAIAAIMGSSARAGTRSALSLGGTGLVDPTASGCTADTGLRLVQPGRVLCGSRWGAWRVACPGAARRRGGSDRLYRAVLTGYVFAGFCSRSCSCSSPRRWGTDPAES